MIEVRSSYMVRMRDVPQAIQLWRAGREQVWPELGWSGRIQQMLHGHAQQSLFVWSSLWPSLAEWEQGMARTKGNQLYTSWSSEMNTVRVYGGEREIFTVLEPALALDVEPGRVEVRSSYLVPMEQVKAAQQIMRRGQETIWPELGWSGQNMQMLHGKASQSMFVWSSVWESMAEWEAAMANTRGQAFQDWFADWRAIVDFGGPREVFRNL